MKKLMKIAVVAAVVAAVVKMVAGQKTEWRGLTESEVRGKLDSKLPDRIPEEKRAAVADQVVSAMRDKGVLRDEDEVVDDGDAAEVSDAAQTVAGDEAGEDTPKG